MIEETVIYQCSNIGIAGTTPVHVKQHDDGAFEARCGFALMGATNMTDEEFKAVDYNPFHEKFYDNYSVGKGEDEEKAIAQLKANMKATADSLWV
jgi:hypothetical protein